MGVYLFTALFHLLLFLLMCGTLLCGQVRASIAPQAPASEIKFGLFKKEEIQSGVLQPNGDSEAGKISVFVYYSPLLVATNNVMVAMAGANHTESLAENKNIGILTKYIKKGNDWGKNAVATSNTNWKTQFAIKNENTPSSNGETYILKSLLAVAKGNKVYVLLLNYTKKQPPPETIDWKFKIAVGTVNIEEPATTLLKEIVWGDKTLTDVNVLTEEFKGKLNGGKLDDYQFSGSAFLTREEKVIFALVVTYNNKNMTALVHLKNDRAETELVYEKIDKDCYCHFFPWKEKIIMVPVNYKQEANEKIKETSETKISWIDSKETLFQRYDFFQSKKNFVTVTINDTNVLLFTEEKTDVKKKEIYLWVSDGNHSSKVGTIPMGDGELFESLLYTSGELFFLHQVDKTSEKKSVLRRFPTIGENITTVLTAWETSDRNIKNMCTTTPTTKTPCFTDGLVGFLSNNFIGDYWKDEYYYVNAAVTKKETATSSGLTFKGKGAGAMWPVGKSKEEQPYNFTDEGFTLVATVKIEQNDKENDNSLLGILVNNNSHIGLWCRKDGKWGVSNKNKNEKKIVAAGKNCEQDKTYDVAFVLTKIKKILLYINWQQIGDLPNDINMQASHNITHFYFGVDIISNKNNEVATCSTTTNVMLYNRPFTDNEITELKSKQDNEAETQQRDKNNGTSQQENKGGTTEPDTTLATKNEKEQSSSSATPTTEDSAVRVGVDVLSLLFGVFTLLGRYVY